MKKILISESDPDMGLLITSSHLSILKNLEENMNGMRRQAEGLWEALKSANELQTRVHRTVQESKARAGLASRGLVRRLLP